MKKFDFHVEYDHSHCDLCGPEYAKGYSLYGDGELLSAVHPYAHCYDSISCTDEKLSQAVSDTLAESLKEDFLVQYRYDGKSSGYLDLLPQWLAEMGIQWVVHDYDFGCECEEGEY